MESPVTGHCLVCVPLLPEPADDGLKGAVRTTPTSIIEAVLQIMAVLIAARYQGVGACEACTAESTRGGRAEQRL
jgi:hypothetical protein